MVMGVYVRGPGTTLYHLSRTLRTDVQGLVQATFVKPTADFRWYVRFASTTSAINLVQVR
jgi:hypothetical protein